MSTNKKIHIEVDGIMDIFRKQRLWVAVERKTRLIVGAHLGKRDIEGTQHGIFYTPHTVLYFELNNTNLLMVKQVTLKD
jgi:hypothetical protein